MQMVKSSDTRSEQIIRQMQQQGKSFSELYEFLDFWEQNDLKTEEIKDDNLKAYVADAIYDCLTAPVGKPDVPEEMTVAGYVAQYGLAALLASQFIGIFRNIINWLAEALFGRNEDVGTQAVIGADIDPRGLPDEVKKELGKAADNPEGWGVSEDAFEAWGKRHQVGRVRQSPSPSGISEDMVYDDF